MQKAERTNIILNDILDKCILAKNIIQTFGKEEFLSNKIAQLATERCLEVISIRANFYIRSNRNEKNAIHPILSNIANWQRKINHNYQKLPADTLWETVNELNPLEGLVKDLLRGYRSDNLTMPRSQNTSFILNSGENIPLTTKYLENYIIPYLKAIEELESIIARIHGKPTRKIEIEFIRKSNPYPVGIVGEGIKAIEFIRELIIPWRREYAKNIAKLELEKKEIEIDEIRNKIEKDKNENTEKHYLEVERMKIENLDKKIDLAIKVVEKLSPQLNEKDKIKYISELLRPIGEILASPLVLEPIHEDDENK